MNREMCISCDYVWYLSGSTLHYCYNTRAILKRAYDHSSLITDIVFLIGKSDLATEWIALYCTICTNNELCESNKTVTYYVHQILPVDDFRSV